MNTTQPEAPRAPIPTAPDLFYRLIRLKGNLGPIEATELADAFIVLLRNPEVQAQLRAEGILQ